MKPKNTILVVEDEHINRELLKILLEHQYELTFAADFETASDIISIGTFDLIITDIRLGNRLDGIVLLEQIRKNSRISKTPVAVYTASDTSINQKSFAEEGFDGFISKPVVEAELRTKVAELIGMSK
ncbi:MAG: response regulator [Bacteroidota bacterium]